MPVGFICGSERCSMRRHIAAERVLHELAVTLRAQIETTFGIDIVADQLAVGIFHPFQQLLNFEQMITVVIKLFTIERFHRCLYFQLDDITQVFGRVDDTLTAVTRIMDHP